MLLLDIFVKMLASNILLQDVKVLSLSLSLSLFSDPIHIAGLLFAITASCREYQRFLHIRLKSAYTGPFAGNTVDVKSADQFI